MHPILFSKGGFFIGTYGLLIVVGLVAALAVAVRYARKESQPTEPFYDLAFVALVSGFLGARVLFILLNLEAFSERPLAIAFGREGFVFMGGFVAAVIAVTIFIRRKGMPLWTTADIAAPALAVGHAFGRIGCFLAGCCYGGVCEAGSFFSRIALTFPHVTDDQGKTLLSFAYMDHLNSGLLAAGAERSLPVIPTQLIESAANFLIFAALLFLWKKRKFPGQIFLYYLFFYGTARFGLEFLRGDDRGYWFGTAISTSQGFSLAAIACGAIGWRILSRGGANTKKVRRGRGRQTA